MRIEARFAYRIPAKLLPHLEQVAPLLCAGVTLWEPIEDYVRPGTRVGIRALGGLGHMGVQLASIVGAEVTVLSHSDSKKDRALKLGAHRFVNCTDQKALDAVAGSLDVLIDTCPYQEADVEDMNKWMGLLAFGGTYVKCGIPGKSFQFSWIPIIFTQKKIAGYVAYLKFMPGNH